MISSTELKKLATRHLKPNLKELGFIGSGFRYRLNTPDFIFCIGIQPNQYGGQCCVELGVQPKALFGTQLTTIDEAKLQYYDCALRSRLSPKPGMEYWWQYSVKESKNIQMLQEIYEVIKSRALLIIRTFIENTNLLTDFGVTDLNDPQKCSIKMGGLVLMTDEIYLAWIIAILLEKTNLEKARGFAKFALERLAQKQIPIGKKHQYLVELLEKPA